MQITCPKCQQPITVPAPIAAGPPPSSTTSAAASRVALFALTGVCLLLLATTIVFVVLWMGRTKYVVWTGTSYHFTRSMPDMSGGMVTFRDAATQEVISRPQFDVKVGEIP